MKAQLQAIRDVAIGAIKNANDQNEIEALRVK